MAEDRKQVVLGAELDATGVRQGAEQVKQAVKDMAREVGQSTAQVGKGVGGIGDGADGSAKKVDRATKSIIASIERATAAVQAGSRGTADQIEALAKLRGVSGDAIKPYLEGLRQAEAAQKLASKSLDGMAMSAKQTTAALRQVPAQFTDIITSLQGGQAPLTVLLQQGGQLKDVFGGIAPAAKALGGFIAGLVTPLTVAGAAATAVAAGFVLGRKEAEEFNKALLLTGNQAGLTVGQLSAMAARLDGLGTTQGKASEALGEFVRAGRVGADSLDRFALAAINLEKVGGAAVQETAKAFAELGKDPLTASLKLNEATGFLTRSVYEQIQALTDQGRGVEAAKVAQDAYAASIEDAVPKIVAQLGYVEQAWKGITTFAKEAADAIKDIGRVDNTLQAAIARTQNQLDGANAVGDATAANEAQRLLERLQQSLKLEQDVGKAKAEQAKQVERAVEADKELERLGIKRLTLAQQEEALRRRLVDGGKSEETIQKAITALRERSVGKDGKAAAREREQELQREAALLEKLAGLSGTYYRDLEDLNRARERGTLTQEQYVQAVTELTEAQPFAVKGAKALAEQLKGVAEAEAAGIKLRDQYIDGLSKGADAAAKQVQQLQDEQQATELASTGHRSLAQAIQLVAIARLQDQQTAAGRDDIAVAAIQREIDKRKELIGLIGGQEIRQAAEEANKELDKLFDASRAESFGDALTGAFAQAGNSLAQLSGALQAYGRTQEEIAKRQAVINASNDPAKKQREQLKLNEASQKANIALYANMAGAAKGFFSEGTKGYKALEAAETAFRAYQLASDLIKGVSAATVAVANQAQGDPYTAFPRMAAMAAAMAALGFAVTGGFNSGPSGGGDGRPVNTGTGTVFGDAGAESESIANSIERLADTARVQLTTQSGMLASLRNIENSIGGLAGLLVRGDITAAAERGISLVPGRDQTQTFGQALTLRNFNTQSVIDGPLMAMFHNAIGNAIPFIGSALNSIFGGKQTITASGLYAGPQDLLSIMSSGLNLQSFADVKTDGGWFRSDKNSTQYQAADTALSNQFSLVFRGFTDAIKLAAGPLDQNLQGVTDRLSNFVVDIGKLDFKDLTGEEIQERLSAVLGAAADSIASAALPGLQAFQVVGEGYFETVIRVASGVETAEAALELLGIGAINFTDIIRKQGDVAAEIVRQSIVGFEALDGSLSSVGQIIGTLDGTAEDLTEVYSALVDTRDILLSVGESGDALTAAMIRGAGGLDALQSSLGDYFENFFSETERRTAGLARLSTDFGRLGVGELPTTREAFRAIVEGVDTTTEAGQKLFAQLIGLSGTFAELVDATAGLGNSAAEAAAKMAEAGQRVLGDLAKQREQLEVQLLRAQGNTVGADARSRELSLAALTAGLNPADAAAAVAAFDFVRAMEAQIAVLNDATRAAEQAAAAEQTRIKAVASERAALDQRLLQAQGDIAGLRALELASLDASNRAIQERIYALEDAAAADAAANQAAEAAAQEARAIAEQRAGLDRQVLELEGRVSEIRAAELAALDPSLRAIQARIFALQDEAAETQRLANIANQGQSLQTRIEELLGQTAELRERELAAIDPANRGLQLLIWELEDAAAAAQQAAAIASERAGIERQILQLTGDTAAIRAIELAGLDASNRALQERIYALQDAAEAEAEAAQKARQIASERTSLEQRLLQLQGNTTELRARELAALDPSNRALLEQIYALEDQQTAAAEAAAALERFTGVMTQLGDTRFDLENQLLGLQGNSEEVRRRTRERELARLTEGATAEEAARITAAYDLNTALQDQIKAMQDAQTAAQAAAEAADQVRQAWKGVTDSLFDEANRIREMMTGQASANSLAQTQARFFLATAQARAGSQAAAQSLPALAQSLLTAAEGQVRSFAELQVLRAQTAASLESTGSVLNTRFGLDAPGPTVTSDPQVLAELRSLRDENQAQARALVTLQQQWLTLLNRWETNGLPETREVDA